MKRTTSKNMFGFILKASLVLVVASCMKEQNTDLKRSLSEAQLKSNSELANQIGGVTTCSPIPDSLRVPAGNKFILQTFARGVQIYEVKRSPADPNAFIWVNIAPLATLYTKPDFTNLVINHFAGPSWQFVKGPYKDEKVVATKVSGITKDATAIQWLLLKADDALSTPGNKVTFIQRICTKGGLAPTTIVNESNFGQLDSIPYTASYLFYIKD